MFFVGEVMFSVTTCSIGPELSEQGLIVTIFTDHAEVSQSKCTIIYITVLKIIYMRSIELCDLNEICARGCL
jgi:hypothetical protein